MNWEYCIICGKSDGQSGGDLNYPADRPNDEALKYYGDLLRNVKGFMELDKFPVDLAITGCESAAESLKNRAK